MKEHIHKKNPYSDASFILPHHHRPSNEAASTLQPRNTRRFHRLYALAPLSGDKLLPPRSISPSRYPKLLSIPATTHRHGQRNRRCTHLRHHSVVKCRRPTSVTNVSFSVCIWWSGPHQHSNLSATFSSLSSSSLLRSLNYRRFQEDWVIVTAKNLESSTFLLF